MPGSTCTAMCPKIRVWWSKQVPSQLPCMLRRAAHSCSATQVCGGPQTQTARRPVHEVVPSLHASPLRGPKLLSSDEAAAHPGLSRGTLTDLE